MTTWVGLLRGINVGKAKRIAMADLRALVEDAGFADARTLLNSGNVVFKGPRAQAPKVAARLEKAIEDRVGFHSHVVVPDAATIETIVTEHTLHQADNPSRLLIGFVQDATRLQSLAALAARKWEPEALAVGSYAAYMWTPEGIVDSALVEAVSRALGTYVTTRNWATVQKLHAMTRE
jgi:uncharacterized protein (DUF1697 family)